MSTRLFLIALVLGTVATAVAFDRCVVLEMAYAEYWGTCASSSGLLDQICDTLPGRVAHIELHCRPEYPLHCPEARQKWFLYPSRGGSYYYPSLYVDGKDCGSSPSAWAGYISAKLSEPSNVGLTHVGTTYNPATRSGQLQVECYNNGVGLISAALQFAITEDSINYSAPNGDQWHNAVCRDFVPTQLGTSVTLPSGRRDTVTIPFELQADWVEENVKLVVYLQNMTLQGDTLACYQSLTSSVLEFVAGVEEPKLLSSRDLRVQVSPNPCRTGCEFAISGAAANGGRVTVYAPDGRQVADIAANGNRAFWNCNRVARGVYLYRVNAGTATAEGKLVVTDWRLCFYLGRAFSPPSS
jgi:hypothetical protein